MKSPNYGWQLAALSYTAAMNTLLFNIQPVFVGVLNQTFGFDEQQLGELLSAGFLSSCLVLGSSYFWANRVRRQRAIAIGIAFGLLGLSFQYFASDFATVMVGIVLASAGLSVTAAPVMLGLASMPNPTQAFSFAICAMVLIAGVCTLLIPTVLFPYWAYHGVIGFLIGLVALTLLLLPMIPESATITGDSPSVVHSTLSKAAWLLLVATVIYFVGLNSNWAFLETLGNHAGIETPAVSVSITLGLLLGLVGSGAAAIVHNRISVQQAMFVSLGGCLVYVVILTNTPGPLAFGLAVVLFCAVWNFSLPYTMNLVRSYDNSGKLLALVPAAQSLGGAIGPLFAGPLLMASGPKAVYLLLLGCVLFASVAFSWFVHRIIPTDSTLSSSSL